MGKTNFLWIILGSIFLVVFNIIFFVLGGVEHDASVWISYGFIHFAYFMLLLTSKLIRAGRSSTVFGLSLYFISAAYFLVAFATGMKFILTPQESYEVAFSVQLGIAGLYGIWLTSHMLANERTADAEEGRPRQIEYVKNASLKLKSSLDRINDKEAKKKVEKAYDALYSSPVKSHPDLAQLENRILLSINELDGAVSAGNKERMISLADSLLLAINERNMQLKTLQKT